MAGGLMERAPTASGQMLLALDMFLGPTPEIVVVGNGDHADTAAALRELRHRFIPNKVVAGRLTNGTTSTHRSPAMEPLFAGKVAAVASDALYVCENFACQAPAVDLKAAIAPDQATCRLKLKIRRPRAQKKQVPSATICNGTCPRKNQIRNRSKHRVARGHPTPKSIASNPCVK